MKKSLKIACILLAFCTLNSCGSSQEKNKSLDRYELVENPPFKISSAFFQKWIAGVQGGGSGTNVTITVDYLKKDVEILDLYFQSKKAPLKVRSKDAMIYDARFKGEANIDITMDINPIKEAVNTPPVMLPFRLSEKEAVLSFIEKGAIGYFKISEIKEKPMIAYPKAKPNNKE